MLKYMRSHLGKYFLMVIVFAIAVVFVLWGVFPDVAGRRAGGSDVAVVGDETISVKDFAAAYNRDIESYRSLGMDLPKELIMNVKNGTLQNLVNQKLMLVEAQRIGIGASDSEVAAEIQKLPYFIDKEKKAFSVDLYKRLLAANNLSTGQFEQNVRESLTNQRMMSFLESRLRVTPTEVEREFKISNETRDLTFVRLTREDAMKRMKVDPKDLDAFLADKKKQPELESYYAQNNNRYNKPEEVCARHILKREDPKAKSTSAPAGFLALKPSTGNFATVAKKNSEDPGSKEKGGDLGCFPKGMMDKAFEQTAFSIPIGKISPPVHSAFGWHYILVYKKVPAVKITLDSAKREIAEDMLKRARVDEIRKINKATAEEIAASWPPKGEKVENTGFFNGLEGHIPKIGRADEILKAAFDPKAKIQTSPQVFESQGSYIVAKVKDKKNADMSQFQKDQENLVRGMRERKLRAFIPAWMEDVRSRTKISTNTKVVDQF